MNKNQENNDIYVMADDDEAFVPPVSGFLLPWWIFVLPFLLVGGLAIAYITNAHKYKSTTKPGIPTVENLNSGSSSTDNNVTNNSNSNSPSGNNNVTNNPNSNSGSSSTNNNSTNNPNSNLSSGNNNVANNPNSNPPATKNNPKSLEITEKVYFDYKETEVRSSDAPKLESFLSQLPDTNGTLIIAGHSDDIGPDEYNQNLARRRAEQVASKLRELGLDQQYQVKIESWGETQPTGNNETDQGRALNRRVVLSFTNSN